MGSRKRIGKGLLAILVLGLFFRIYDLGTESIWLDEGFSISMANLNWSMFLKATTWEFNPPLYYFLLRYWIKLFGNSEFATRFLSVIFGFFALFMIYKVGSLMFNKNVGLLSSLLLALSRFHIHYSQEARAYSLLVVLALLSMYFFLRLLREVNLAVSCGYIISSNLLMYTHVYGFFIIIAQNIYIITMLMLSIDEHKHIFRKWVLMQGILVILYIPRISVLMTQISIIQSGYWIPVPTIRSIIDTLARYSAGSHLLLLVYLILLPFSIVTCERIKGKFDRRDIVKSTEGFLWNVTLQNIDRILLLLAWLSTPIILPFIISQFSQPIYRLSGTITASLAFYLLVAKGIDNITNLKSIRLGIISLVVIFSSVDLWGYYNEVNKEQWREVAKYVDMNAEPGDLILFNAGFTQAVFDYYSKRIDLKKKPFPERGLIVDEVSIKEFGSTVDGFDRIWVVLSHSRDYNGLIKKALSESYKLLYNKQYVGIDLSMFEK